MRMIWQVLKGFVNLMGLAAPLFKCVISAMCNHVAGPGAKFVSSGCCCEKRSMRHGVLIWQDMAGKLEKFKVWPDVQVLVARMCGKPRQSSWFTDDIILFLWVGILAVVFFFLGGRGRVLLHSPHVVAMRGSSLKCADEMDRSLHCLYARWRHAWAWLWFEHVKPCHMHACMYLDVWIAWVCDECAMLAHVIFWMHPLVQLMRVHTWIDYL